MVTIVVIEDELNVAAALQTCISSIGYQCHIAYDGSSGLALIQEVLPDIVVLDLGLPGALDGIEVCNHIRRSQFQREPYIMMLTARVEDDDRMVGYASGADDYLPKPYRPQELILRLRTLLRREQRHQARLNPTHLIETAHLQIFPERRTVKIRSVGSDEWLPIYLTALEFEVLLQMAMHPGRVWSRRQLLDVAWEPSSVEDERSVDSCIKRLRNQLGVYERQQADRYRFIKTVSGVGYAFEDAQKSIR